MSDLESETLVFPVLFSVLNILLSVLDLVVNTDLLISHNFSKLPNFRFKAYMYLYAA